MIGALFQFLNAGAEHRVEQAKIDAARITQKAQNEASAKLNALNVRAQDIARQHLAKRSEQQLSALQSNFQQNLDHAMKGTAQQRMQAAAAIGAATAGAAAAGTGGAAIETYNRTVALNQAMQEAEQDRGKAIETHWFNQRSTDILLDAVMQQDTTVFTPQLDMTTYMDHTKQGGFGFALLAGVAGTAIGGPAVGMQAFQGAAEMSRGQYYNNNFRPQDAQTMFNRGTSTLYDAAKNAAAYTQGNKGTYAGSWFGDSSPKGSPVTLYGLKV